MKNQLTQAVSQHRYNSWVLNFIILGVIASILTAIFIPWGYGKFSGISFLIGTQITAIIASMATQTKRDDGSNWVSYFIPFCFLLFMSIVVTSSLFIELLNMGHSYADVRKMLPGSDTKKAGIILGVVTSTLFGLFGVLLTRNFRRKNTFVDYFLLNPAIANLFWKRSGDVKVDIWKSFTAYSAIIITIFTFLSIETYQTVLNEIEKYPFRDKNSMVVTGAFCVLCYVSLVCAAVWLALITRKRILKEGSKEALVYNQSKTFAFLRVLLELK